MRTWLPPLGRALGTILGAHALAYLLIGVLPSASVAALGIFSTNQELLSAFARSSPTRSYRAAVGGLFAGDLGKTLDGQTVVSELWRAGGDSAFRLGMCVFILAGVCLATALLIRGTTSVFRTAADFSAFLPPFVAPFLGLAAILTVEFSAGTPVSRTGQELVAVLALSMGGAAVLAGQTARITQRNLQSEFARSLRAAGASPRQTRLRLLHNLAAEISPTFEKLVVGLAAALFFVEPTLGLAGFGTLAARAVRRSDVDLLLGVTLTFAIAVALSRIVVAALRTAYGMED